MTRDNELISTININPTIHTSSKYYSEEKTELITIFPNSGKQRESLSILENILFKEDT